MPLARRIAVRKGIINMVGYQFSQFEVDADEVIEVTNEDRVKLKNWSFDTNTKLLNVNGNETILYLIVFKNKI